jgi:hypothetical protein
MALTYNVEDLGSPHTAERLASHQDRLNQLAVEGWELVAVAGSVGYFRRDSADAGKAPDSPPEKPVEETPPRTESGTAHSDDSDSRENRNPEGGRRGSGRHGRHG